MGVWRRGGGTTARQSGNTQSQALPTSQTQQWVQDRDSRPGLQPPQDGWGYGRKEEARKGEEGWAGPTDLLALSSDYLAVPSWGWARVWRMLLSGSHPLPSQLYLLAPPRPVQSPALARDIPDPPPLPNLPTLKHIFFTAPLGWAAPSETTMNTHSKPCPA